MKFLIGFNTDIGIKRKTNQDALLAKVAKTDKGEVGLFVVCDGVGGLAHGEIASSTVVYELAKWFEEELPEIISRNCSEVEINNSLARVFNAIFFYGN